MNDYSTSRYENALAETADEIVLQGGSTDSIYDGEAIAFDLVRSPQGPNDPTPDYMTDYVILRRDSQGFIWVEWAGSDAEWKVNGSAHWQYLRREYERDEV